MWFTKSPKDVLKELNVSEKTGLSTEEVKKRLEKYGPNKLKKFIAAIFGTASGYAYLCVNWCSCC